MEYLQDAAAIRSIFLHKPNQPEQHHSQIQAPWIPVAGQYFSRISCMEDLWLSWRLLAACSYRPKLFQTQQGSFDPMHE